RYAAHAQVLADHPAFDWCAVVDHSESAREAARTTWGVPTTVADARELGALANDIEVAVLATPPASRARLLDHFPALRAVLVEKPLGRTLDESAAFLQRCRERGIAVQVNFWRRADERFREFAGGGLTAHVGALQTAF